LAKCGKNVVVYGVSPDDISPARIAERNEHLAEENYNPIILKEGKIEDLGDLFRGENIKFDVISCMNVLHFRPPGELQNDFKNIRQLSKPGGSLFLVTHGGSKDDGLALAHGGYNAADSKRLIKFRSLVFIISRLSGVVTKPIIFHEAGELKEKLDQTGFAVRSLKATEYKFGPIRSLASGIFYAKKGQKWSRHPWSLYIRADQKTSNASDLTNG
jgi:SAM-dependent methyltransferase